jgi:DNA-binding LacI/PurR family transcriptional regulator
VSVIGFDDIKEAAFQTPSLTTIRQPLHAMGTLAVEILLGRIKTPGVPPPADLAVEPELIIRESTGPPRNGMGKGKSTRSTRQNV